jgi:3-phosphoshikimate 1-carboxyvinyltransferase
MIEVIPLQKSRSVNTKKEIRIPGSKSYTNRALLLAALAKGKSTLINPLKSDDTSVLVAALRKLGIEITIGNGKYLVYGSGGKFRKPAGPLYLGNAGTAVRFLTAVLTASNFKSVITGNKRMQKRPVGDLIDALRKLGTNIKATNDCPPIVINGGLRGGTTVVKGNISSQYLSALLMASPLAKIIVTVKVNGHLTSLPYVKMTLDAMGRFGVRVTAGGFGVFKIQPSSYKPAVYTVEGDASSASYFWAIAALNRCRVKVLNINPTSAQADIGLLEILKKMGCKIVSGRNFVSVSGPAKLKALDKIDLNHMPDSAMTTAILAAFANGKSVLKNLGNLRVKECDRLKALFTEIRKIGADVKEGRDRLEINGRPDTGQSAIIDTYDDHRMAMCFAVAGSKIPGIQIQNPQCVSKTYPDFWRDLRKIGLKTKTCRISSKENIVLGGLRGTGKTMIGKRLAALLNYNYVDTDEYIQTKEKRRIAQIFKESGWRYFRKLETVAASELGRKKRTVISTGGGMFINDRNARTLKKNGIVVLLTCPPEIAAARIKGDKNRPPLTGLTNSVKELSRLWKERKGKYLKAADLVIDTSAQSANIHADTTTKAKRIITLLHAG